MAREGTSRHLVVEEAVVADMVAGVGSVAEEAEAEVVEAATPKKIKRMG